MKKTMWALFFLISSLAWADPECDLQLFVTNPVLQITDSSQVIQLTATVTRGNASPSSRCDYYRVFFNKGLANSYQRQAFSLFGGHLNYNLHSQINQVGILKDYGDALNSSEFLEGASPNRNTSYTQKFYISTPGMSNTTIRRGIYVDTVQASVYSYKPTSGKYEFEDVTTLTVFLNVPSQIDLSLVEEGGAFDASSTSRVIDFGIIEKNEVKGVDLRIVANTPYRVSLSSGNGSRMKGPNQSYIHYAFKVNGSSVNLPMSGGSVGMGQGGPTTAAGDRFNLKFQILDDTKDASSGIYQDNITITAIAN